MARPVLRFALAALFAAACIPVAAQHPAGHRGELNARHQALRDRLSSNPFGRPLAIDSREGGGALRGEVHAVLDHPFAKVRDALSQPASWCEVLTLPFNVQRCDTRGDALTVHIGRKPDSPLEDATRLELGYTLAARTDDALEIQLAAPQGPAGTTDYRISFAAIPIEGDRTFVALRYGYTQGTLSRMAMQAYLSTSGADKVGFSAAGRDEQGKPQLVGGVRGVVERNTMRYFLAIDAYLDTVDMPPAQRKTARLKKWFAETEKYPRQLREMALERYLALKDR